MRRILIVGSGQSGLYLAMGLLSDGYDVTLMSMRTPEEIRAGRVTSTQVLFSSALERERRQGLDLWAEQTPPIERVGVTLAGEDGEVEADWSGRLRGPAGSVDQRLKMAGWLEEFEERGGRVVIHGATVSDLEWFAGMYDLVVIAAGKGELVDLFDRDAERSPGRERWRRVAVAYVHGVRPRDDEDAGVVRRNMLAGAGELVVAPSLSLDGPCTTLFADIPPGGPMDLFQDAGRGPRGVLAAFLELIRRHAPWEYERCRDAEPVDAGAALAGTYLPVVRHPVGMLPSGGVVLGMADVVVATDPITSQGANSAVKCAEIYRRAIVAHGDRPFDEAFMRAAFNGYWTYARHVIAWTNAMLDRPQHVLELLRAGEHSPELAERFANGFDDPTDFLGWFLHPERAVRYLRELHTGV
ncbi:styrene monooxygenase/indole monooxygenase family protein [Marinactinospora thermotolerans]|uniref:2-polyprenyl-6-methoxyphenol hydroxylase n=1 Tax=Marinactinospora thermotolerans DSM 45154 TaxID=1122192 RepID=A0A1T4LDM4_9ACTN|nr:styrene monooxygenase/indole monooxygenase family protein [Marinactinospora thermotolerans]SJZ52668.1 2-polyprenyl-6-methoxyphenol hydroxylase [Marinactinospora thermotolerans DSM 45154]